LETDAVLGELQKAMPSNMSSSRLIRQVITLVHANPALVECTHMSILAGCMQAAELGLELTGPLGHAYLVPRWDKRLRAKVATFQIGWKGLVALAMRSGQLACLSVRTVHANEPFRILGGTSPRIDHEFVFGNKGEPVGYYAVAVYRGGGSDFEFMSKEDVVAHRQKFAPPGDRQSPWDTSFDAMAEKTVVRKLCRRLSLCPLAQEVASKDEYEEAGVFEVKALPTASGSRTAEVSGRLDDALALPAPSEDVQDAEVETIGGD
jgi:recombination protein RecT